MFQLATGLRFTIFTSLLLLAGYSFICLETVFPMGGHVSAQTSSRERSVEDPGSTSTEESFPQEQKGGMMTEEMRGMGHEGMREMMRTIAPPKQVPFYQERTFLVIATALLVLLVVWIVRRWGIRRLKVLRKQGAFANEAILVVDLCESTRLAVTQGDAFAMRITNKMKQCVREVSQTFGASFFESTGDGYLITFPSGVSAVRAAIKIVRNTDDYNRDAPAREKIDLRLGINYGELVLDEKGGRHGSAINKAFRIEGLKKDDQQGMGGVTKHPDFPEKNRIFVSEEIIEELKAAREIQVREVGVFDLKGFTGLHRVYSVLWRDARSD